MQSSSWSQEHSVAEIGLMVFIKDHMPVFLGSHRAHEPKTLPPGWFSSVVSLTSYFSFDRNISGASALILCRLTMN